MSWAGTGPVELGHQLLVGMTGALQVVIPAAELGVELVDPGLEGCHLAAELPITDDDPLPVSSAATSWPRASDRRHSRTRTRSRRR